MEFGILGPLEVRADGHAVPLGGARPRAVFAVLALNANRARQRRPPGPRAMGRGGAAQRGQDRPGVRRAAAKGARRPGGAGDYRRPVTGCGVRPGELDAERFESLVADGRQALAAGRGEDAAAALREALELWRGPPLAEVASAPFAPAEIARLEEQRLAAAGAARGGGSGRRPPRRADRRAPAAHERAPLARAPARSADARAVPSGRQADALEAYRHAREKLASELGIEPGPELHDLHQAILLHDPATQTRRATRRRLHSPASALPAPPNRTVGRAEEFARSAERLRSGAVRLLTLTGPGGCRQDAARARGRAGHRSRLRRRRARSCRSPPWNGREDVAAAIVSGARRSSCSAASQPSRRSNASCPPSISCWSSTTASTAGRGAVHRRTARRLSLA